MQQRTDTTRGQPQAVATRGRPRHQHVLITGANCGLGFEAAVQFAEAGAQRVVVACRTLDRARAACTALASRTRRAVFEPLELDLTSLANVRSAARGLAGRPAFDVVVLNAGVLPGAELVCTSDGLEEAAAVSLVGHHVLTLSLLGLGLLGARARVIVAGSEGARGDVPGMKPIDVKTFASEHCGGAVDQAMRLLITMQPPARHHWSTTYCTTKVLVALWAVALAPLLPRGMTVNAVSPGNTPATNAVRNQPWYFRAMIKLSGVLGPAMGMAASVATGSARYLDAAALGDEVTGAFFASPTGKLIGPLTEQTAAHLRDPDLARGCWRALVSLTGEGLALPASNPLA